jgi:hypothetical protein
MKDGADGKRCRAGARICARFATVLSDATGEPAPDGISRTKDRIMGELIDLDAYRRRKQRGLPRLATSRDPDVPKGPSQTDTRRLGLPKPPERTDDPDAPEPA